MNGIEAAFVGRVARLPELKTSAAGKRWLAVSVVVGQGDDVTWLSVAVFGERAEELAATLGKGDRLYCEGTITLRKWLDKERRERSGLNVAAARCEILGRIGRDRPAKKAADSREALSASDDAAPNGGHEPNGADELNGGVGY